MKDFTQDVQIRCEEGEEMFMAYSEVFPNIPKLGQKIFISFLIFSWHKQMVIKGYDVILDLMVYSVIF